MNYVGKFFSNFKGFYNDINSATLTGAIDILVVRQEDGTYLTSPWHVRFGKMGVIRAKEKVVDIEINGEPVKLCMKLGEAGEAFFVQESESGIQNALYLSESPDNASCLDCLDDNYRGRLDSDAAREHVDPQLEFTDGLCDKQCDTVITIDGDNITVTEVPKATIASVQKENVTMDDNHYFSSHGISIPSSSLRSRKTTGTQTEMSGEEVEAKKSKSRNVSGETVGSRSQSPFLERILLPLIPVETVAKAIGVESLVSRDQDVSRDVKDLSVKVVDGLHSDKEDLVLKDSANSTTPKTDVIGRTDVLGKSPPLDVTSSRKSLPTADHSQLFPVGELFEMELSDDDRSEKCNASVSRETKDHRVSECEDLEPEWTPSAFACSFHPFSDTDLTPVTSPKCSRPPSPKSDTEYETQKYDATSQTQLTGDELMLIDDVKWEWGEFPQVSPHPGKKTSLTSESSSKREDKPSGGLFQFMRKTKKLRHQPLEEGIYLEDLNLANMDPEVAALYLYGAKSGSQLSASHSKDEDSESGQGLSLPQSPVTVDQEMPTIPLVVTDDSTSAPSEMDLSDIAMSLCGGLQDVESGVGAEQFTKYLVTHENLCDNPNLLMDPNLVIRLNGRFYNWTVASAVIMCHLVFKKPLAEQSVENMVKQHMPKKERRRGLWWWSRGTHVTNSTSDVTPNPQAIVGSVSTKDRSSDAQTKVKSKTRKTRCREGSTSGDESDSVSPAGENTSGSVRIHTREKFIKSLKLTSDQLASLNLKDGANEVMFSVTTQYQGTSRCHCYLYLWNWNDRIIVSDIDGTITRSDVWGQVLPMIGKDWSQAGIANLYSMINQNGYKFLYLSARAIGQSKITRDYLHSVRQGDLYLPDGPLLLSPSSLLSAFYKEVIERKPEEFKIGCLRDIGALFPSTRTPFYAGFGNKVNDTFAYRTVGIPIARIFTVNPKGELSMGLSFQSSYTKLSDIVDHFFPPLLHCDCHHEVVEAGKFPGATEYSDFTYWREPFPDIQDDLVLISNTKSDKNTTRKSTREKLRQSKKGKKK